MNEPARTLANLNADMLAGHHVGVQVFAAIDGETVIDLAVGEAAAEIPMTVGTIVEWASATKALTATAIGLLWDEALSIRTIRWRVTFRNSLKTGKTQ